MADCTITSNGDICLTPADRSDCNVWDLTQQSKTNCLANAYQQESLNIAGAHINVLKLLGVHEQTMLIDLVGNGSPISGGDHPHFPSKNAFTKFVSEWRSLQSGSDVLASSYLGYDFGIIKVVTGRQRYGIDTSIRHHITTIKIKQGPNPANRVMKARIERSENGHEWYGVAIINLPDNDELNTIHFKHSVTNRYWRIRPLIFGGTECDSWVVRALELHDYSNTDISNIQDMILMENRDRNYASSYLELRGFYDLISPNTDLTRFGFELPSLTYQIKVNFNSCVSLLGRPIVIGDIIELPSETQYTTDLTPVKKYVEVTDVTWDSSTYTPGWQPTMLMVTAQPALASQETQDIFGDLAAKTDTSGLFDNDDGNNPTWQDFSAISQEINQQAYEDLSERGSDAANVIRQFETETLELAQQEGIKNLSKLGLDPIALYNESAIPPNNAPFTEGPNFPDTHNNGDYHRLTYVGLSKDVPARLYRWSDAKGRWVYLETDRRQQFNDQKAILEDYTTSRTKKSAKDIK